MKRHMTRPSGADPLSTSGTPAGRAPRWPLRVGIVALAGIALAAPMVAADPAAAPPKPAAVAAESKQTSVDTAQPAQAVKAPAASRTFWTLGLTATIAAAGSAGVAGQPLPEPPALKPAPTPTTTAPPAPPTTVAPTPAPAPAVSNGSTWDRLAQCEAGGNWAINTGNGYYGGLQFSASSWRGVGGSGLPHQASRATQIAMGERLRAAQGWGAWPSCSSKLGLR